MAFLACAAWFLIGAACGGWFHNRKAIRSAVASAVAASEASAHATAGHQVVLMGGAERAVSNHDNGRRHDDSAELDDDNYQYHDDYDSRVVSGGSRRSVQRPSDRGGLGILDAASDAARGVSVRGGSDDRART